MKTKILFSCLLIFISFSALAQEETTPSRESFFKYGIKFGYDLSPVTINPQEMLAQFENGYQGGVFLQFGRTIYLQPEIYYASYSNLNSSMVSGEKTQTLRAPILLGLRLINLGIVSLHLMGGPVYNTYLSDIKEGVNMDKVWYNWQAGAGVDILGFITADVRYNLVKGMDVYEKITNFDPKTEMLNVTIGLKLR